MDNVIFPRGVEIVVGTVIRRPDGNILLASSPKWHGKWTLPGGHIEPGETIEEAALRECEEETGLKGNYRGTLHQGELIGSKDFHRPAHFVFLDCLIDVPNLPVALQAEELEEYRWCTPEEALRLDLGESYEESIRAYIASTK